MYCDWKAVVSFIIYTQLSLEFPLKNGEKMENE